MLECPVTMPSASGSSRVSTGYRSCRVRNGGAIGSGLGLILSIEWQRAQLARANWRPRCTPGDCACASARQSARAISPTIRRIIPVQPTRTHPKSNSLCCYERCKSLLVGAVFGPARRFRLIFDLMLAKAFAVAIRTATLQVTHDDRIDHAGVQADLSQAARQQIGRVMVAAGQLTEFRARKAEVVSYPVDLDWIATCKLGGTASPLTPPAPGRG